MWIQWTHITEILKIWVSSTVVPETLTLSEFIVKLLEALTSRRLLAIPSVAYNVNNGNHFPNNSSPSFKPSKVQLMQNERTSICAKAMQFKLAFWKSQYGCWDEKWLLYSFRKKWRNEKKGVDGKLLKVGGIKSKWASTTLRQIHKEKVRITENGWPR